VTYITSHEFSHTLLYGASVFIYEQNDSAKSPLSSTRKYAFGYVDSSSRVPFYFRAFKLILWLKISRFLWCFHVL